MENEEPGAEDEGPRPPYILHFSFSIVRFALSVRMSAVHRPNTVELRLVARAGLGVEPMSRRATDWLMERSQANGLLANPNIAAEAGRYMYGHGFGVLFLSQVYGEEEDNERRRKLEDFLTRAVDFIGKAQTTRGGWYYTSAADGHDMDEGSVTVTQMQALRAAKNAGIVVPKSIIDKALKYLENSTTEGGGVIYSLSQAGGRAMGGGQPALTAAAVACAFSSGEYNGALPKK